ncbi:hypothetical protein GCM10020256_64440 [Streptomyces thermocoprophilus]
MTIRYSWWGPEERQKRISQSIRLFEKKFPKIKVKTDFQDCVAFREKFQTQAAGGNPPDVFQSAVGFSPEVRQARHPPAPQVPDRRGESEYPELPARGCPVNDLRHAG